MRSTAFHVLQLPAGAWDTYQFAGALLKIESCSLPAPGVTVVFDNEGQENPIKTGLKISPEGGFNILSFHNTTAADAVITFWAGAAGVDMAPPDSRQAPTYPKGCLGFAAQADLDALFSWYVSGVTIAAGGTGYRPGEQIPVAGGTGVICILIADQVDSITGAILHARVSGGKRGSYTVKPVTPNNPAGGSGTGASFNLTFTSLNTGIAFNAGGTLTIQAAAALPVPNVDGGNIRDTVVFGVTAGTLLVQDMAGRTFMTIAAGLPVAFKTTSALVLSGFGGAATFTIGEFYYSQQ